MIGRLRGELLEIDGSLVTILVAGVGYEILVAQDTLAKLPLLGEGVELYTRQIFREDSATLYGFFESFERRFFDLLLSVNGCGPKVALAVLGQLGAQAAATAITVGDAKTLTKVTGVGAKMGERMVLELKDKVGQETFTLKLSQGVIAAPRVVVNADLVEALVGLGYKRNDAEIAAAFAHDQGGDDTAQLKLALGHLSR